MVGDFPTGPGSLGNITYEYDYFAGSQVLVYFAQVLVDDIVRIAWNVQQARTPVYGYASQYYSALGAGTIIVHGSFWIAFKEAAYIPIILETVTNGMNPSNLVSESPAILPSRGNIDTPDTELRESSRLWESGPGGGGRTTRENIERLIQRRHDHGDSDIDTRSLANLLTQLGAASDRQFENVAEVFEDILWYGPNRGEGRESAFSANRGYGIGLATLALKTRRADQFAPFDIIITFGDINTPQANHTLYRILDATITSHEFGGIEPTGEPIFCRYDFVARNVI